MPAQTEHRFPLDLSVLDAAGSRVTPADLRGHTGWRPPCPPAASTARRCRPRPAGPNAPAILPQCATKG